MDCKGVSDNGEGGIFFFFSFFGIKETICMKNGFVTVYFFGGNLKRQDILSYFLKKFNFYISRG